MKLTNTFKHFGVGFLVGFVLALVAIVGKAQGLGYFPPVAALIAMVWVEYRQRMKSGLSWRAWARRSLLDSIVDIIAGMAGYALAYHGLLKIFTGLWVI